jgi:chromosome segregation ATPase
MEQRRQIADRIGELQEALARLDRKLDGYEERMLKIEENLYQSPD